MSIFSWIRRNRRHAQKHNAKVAEIKATEQNKPAYQHVVSHAREDSINTGAPPSWRYEQSHLIIEQNRRRSLLNAGADGHMHVPRNASSLSRVSFPVGRADPVVHIQSPHRAYSYSGYSNAAYVVAPTHPQDKSTAGSRSKDISRAASSQGSSSSNEDLEMKSPRTVRYSLPVQPVGMSSPTSGLQSPHYPDNYSALRPALKSPRTAERRATALAMHSHRSSSGAYFRAAIPLNMSGILAVPLSSPEVRSADVPLAAMALPTSPVNSVASSVSALLPSSSEPSTVLLAAQETVPEAEYTQDREANLDLAAPTSPKTEPFEFSFAETTVPAQLSPASPAPQHDESPAVVLAKPTEPQVDQSARPNVSLAYTPVAQRPDYFTPSPPSLIPRTSLPRSGPGKTSRIVEAKKIATPISLPSNQELLEMTASRKRSGPVSRHWSKRGRFSSLWAGKTAVAAG